MPVKIRVLSLNVFMRPPGIQEPHGDYKELRFEFLKRKVLQYDVVLLQEMFVAASGRAARLISFARQNGLLYHAGSVYPTLMSSQLVDGGLLILSRFPIVKTAIHRFSTCCGSDALASKGVVYTQLQIVPHNSRALLDVFTTHTQAGIRKLPTEIRWRQIQELATFVRQHNQDGVPAILGGDFNLDSRFDVAFDAEGAPTFTPCTESSQYRELVRFFHDKGISNVLTRHEVTNGNGHGVLRHEWPQELVDKTGKCIDYLFILDSTSKLQLIHAAVDRCALADIDPQDRTLPVTHLSDHWGITATMELNITPSDDLGNLSVVEFEHTNLWMIKVSIILLAASGVVVASGATVLAVLLTF
ncbi:hypothetical protein LEN26_020555 [Aphanomyces euteiches]|nr:hypothetical protein LEN26_020555 [Aphanomyces euteiches]KAH9128950.1 hypothetical protein AeMF1_000952 [Aphanomyces euteiches]KAH9194939.1 hypothetical protein AeNC1_003081 [Aphanomyces euteiches]